ncbi:MAG: YifB family Mg chelatase-like AAA ATPase [Firmicutes bacterium]|nr:YifB family Mg chelatase-like AAA ATPase [Bacillota bacterium]
MLSVIKSYALHGIEGYSVDIEVDSQAGIANFTVVGLPGSGIKEARNRVFSAIKNSGYDFCPKRITVNLAPADTKKEGSIYDFPIAVGFLASTGQLPPVDFSEYVLIGELSLDGGLRRANGIMPILISAYQNGFKKFIIPYENASEASFIEGVKCYPAKNLSEATAFLSGIYDIKPVAHRTYSASSQGYKYDIDLADVKGQTVAKRALEIAVAGGHNMLLSGVPGAGKTMLAKCVPAIMPEMTFEEAIETTKIHSVSGLLDLSEGIISRRPFRSPHHTATLISFTGGGNKSLPGEVSLANNGVLFLDEMPEYNKKVLESLRQPLEDGVISVSRVLRSVEYPARFMMIASMNPCPCGYLGSTQKPCVCTENEKRNYRTRISGPLLDRIDIHAEVDGVEYSDLRSSVKAETSLEVKSRVTLAREIQLNRFKGTNIFCNAQMNAKSTTQFCKLNKECETILEFAYKKFSLSARGAGRILKLARTIADLSAREEISVEDIAEAIQYRVKSEE